MKIVDLLGGQAEYYLNQFINQFGNMFFMLQSMFEYFNRVTPTLWNHIDLVYFRGCLTLNHVPGNGICMPGLFFRLFLHPASHSGKALSFQIKRQCHSELLVAICS